MATRPANYIPAAGHDWLLPLYDPLLRFVLRDASLRREILGHMQIPAGARVLDVGCGTGTQVVLAKQAHPDAEIVGIDGDPKALARARQKVERAGVEVQLDEGLATALPYADARFDRVISSLVFHHLADPDKERGLAEIRRVLAPGGLFLLVDFGAPRNLSERACASLLLRFEHAHSSIEGRMPALLRDAGFARVDDVAQRSMGFARVWMWRAQA